MKRGAFGTIATDKDGGFAVTSKESIVDAKFKITSTEHYQFEDYHASFESNCFERFANTMKDATEELADWCESMNGSPGVLHHALVSGRKDDPRC